MLRRNSADYVPVFQDLVELVGLGAARRERKRQTDRQTDRQTEIDRQIDRETETARQREGHRMSDSEKVKQ